MRGESRVRFGVVAIVRFPWLVALSFVLFAGLAITVPMRGDRAPRLLRWYFERAGGGVVKVGQLLATRYDFLPAVYCEELGRLLDDLRPVDTARLRRAIERSLGRPLSDCFRTFDDVPLATASLAQVHSATLASDAEVVVKVIKPGVAQLVRIDLVFIRVGARCIALLPKFSELNVRGLATELCRLAETELDLRREATTASFFHIEMSKAALPHYAPAVFYDLSSTDVLTMERIRGVSVREILSAIHAGDDVALATWAARGITPEATARLLFRSVLEQSMRMRAFHADPHPSNLIVSDGGQLNWVDFGLVGWLDEKEWELQIRLRRAFANERIHAAYTIMLESVGPIPPGRDLRSFEIEIKEALHEYLRAARDPTAPVPIAQRSTGTFLLKTLGALRRHRIPIAVGTMQLYRAILIADIVMLRLDSRVDWVAELEDFLVEQAAELIEEAVVGSVEDSDILFGLLELPRTLSDGMEWVNRRLLSGPSPPPTVRSTVDELVLSTARLLRIGLGLVLLLGLALWTGIVAAPTSGWASGSAQWLDENTLASLLMFGGGLLVVRAWIRRVDF